VLRGAQVFQSTAAAQAHCTRTIALPTVCHKRRFSRVTMRGATANSTSNASKAPGHHKGHRAAGPRLRTWPSRGLAAINSSTPQAMDTQVCALNSLAAMRPAIGRRGQVGKQHGNHHEAQRGQAAPPEGSHEGRQALA
jgi:hypothetical protein